MATTTLMTPYGEVRTPGTLYKYRGLNEPQRDFTANIILHRELWWSPAAQLNDDLDCNPQPRLAGSTIKNDLAKRRLLRQMYPDLPSRLIKQAASRRSNADFEAAMANLVAEYRAHIGVCSLSEDPAAPKLWTDYADEHRGICLRFDDVNVDPQSGLSATPHFGLAMPVTYQDRRPEIPIFATDEGYEKLTAYLLTKTRQWKYEAEWRLVDFHGTGNRVFPAACLSGVIFGKSISEEDRKVVTDWIGMGSTTVELLQADEIDGHIEVRPIT